MPAVLNDWVQAAKQQPVAFAQVREDPRMDLALLELLGKQLDVVMIASGGCTAAALIASERVASIRLVDANPAQLALTAAKLELLRTASIEQRMKMLGHLPELPYHRERKGTELLTRLGLPENSLGQIDVWSRLGWDHCGRYELLFRQLASQLASAHHDRSSRAVVFREVMHQRNLEALFGPAATANRATDFWKHFLERTDRALADDPQQHGPFLSQMLQGRFVESSYDWLDESPPSVWPTLHWHLEPVAGVLTDLDAASCDFLHLSNVLDWLCPQDAADLLHQATRVLRPGGLVAIRQLNSTLRIPELEPGLEWQATLSSRLHRTDRSFFYRDFHVGMKARSRA